MVRLLTIFALSLFAFGANATPDLLSDKYTGQPIEIDADSLEVFQKEKKAIFDGNVIAKQGTMRLRSDKMTVYYGGEERRNDTNSIKKIEVAGNVFLASPRETAKGSSGYYDTQNNIVLLVGNVVLTRGENVIKGNRLVYDIDAGQSRMESTQNPADTSNGRVRGLFVPDDKNSGDGQ